MMPNEQLLNALIGFVTAAIPILSAVGIYVMQRIAKRVGVEINQGQLNRLDAMLINGMNSAAATAKEAGSMPRDRARQFIIDQTLNYVGRQGNELLSQLGAKINDIATQDALRARIETLIARPEVPTPPEAEPKPPGLERKI